MRTKLLLEFSGISNNKWSNFGLTVNKQFISNWQMIVVSAVSADRVLGRFTMKMDEYFTLKKIRAVTPILKLSIFVVTFLAFTGEYSPSPCSPSWQTQTLSSWSLARFWPSVGIEEQLGADVRSRSSRMQIPPCDRIFRPRWFVGN